MKSFSKIALSLAVSLTLLSCQKEGPQGDPGPEGPAGPAGPAGPTGTANVRYSAWFTPSNHGGWVDTTINGAAQQKKFRRPAPLVTQAILDQGMVLSYMKLNPDGTSGSTASIRQLPYINAGSQSEYMQLVYRENITYALISVTNAVLASPSSSIQFRYLIVPGGSSAGRSSEKIFHINGRSYSESFLRAMSYEEVCSLLNIPE